jgi:flagellar export protein FliJ
MRRHHFALAAVLRARRTQEQLAHRGLAEAHKSVRQRAAAVEARAARYRDAMATAPRDSLDLRGLLMLRTHQQAAAGAYRSAVEEHLRAQADMETARLAYRDAAQKVATLERLEERQRREHHQAAAKAETARTIDAILARHPLAAQQ